ncbi:MAG TPA: polyprenol monophosphomannose synthase [Anaerolineaceae bacterium]|mgnify:CR=1 FL=1|nr:polyprenol monophosphomannose synthase [Anaerolineaceae bacterium]
MSIGVIIPTYNEKENLPLLAERLFTLPLPNLSLLIIDDNSPDGTGAIAEELALQHPGQVNVIHRSGKLGLGSAYVTGFKHLLAANTDYIVQMDADFSHPPEKILEFYDAIRRCDVVFGSRYIPGGSLDRNWPAWRKGLSSFGNVYARTILGMPVKDITGGYRMWRRETLAAIPWERVRSNGYVFQVEMAYVTTRLGFHICEVPIYFAERQLGQSKMNLSIQVEAAVGVWGLLSRYRDLKPLAVPRS